MCEVLHAHALAGWQYSLGGVTLSGLGSADKLNYEGVPTKHNLNNALSPLYIGELASTGGVTQLHLTVAQVHTGCA